MAPRTPWSGLVDVKWVSRRLGLAEGTVRELARRGELKAIRVGKSWRFDPGDLELNSTPPERFAILAEEPPAEAAQPSAATSSLAAALAESALDEGLRQRTVESVIASLRDPDTALPDGVQAAAVEVSDNTFVLRTAPGSTSKTARALLDELARVLGREEPKSR